MNSDKYYSVFCIFWTLSHHSPNPNILLLIQSTFDSCSLYMVLVLNLALFTEYCHWLSWFCWAFWYQLGIPKDSSFLILILKSFVLPLVQRVFSLPKWIRILFSTCQYIKSSVLNLLILVSWLGKVGCVTSMSEK